MDTTKLQVGQIVHLRSGIYGCSGKVIRVGPDGVDVDMRWESRLEIWKFDANGKACDSRSVGHIPEPFEADGAPATFECGWYFLVRAEDMK
jgi:hypothetical protein